MSATERMQAMIATACLGKDAHRAFSADFGAFLDAHGVSPDDREALLRSPRRLGLYRRLVRRNLSSITETMLELTRARLELRARGEFDSSVGAFLDELGPRTHHLRDVPSEFLAFAARRWRGDPRLPPWIADHAELELADFAIGVAPRPDAPPPLAEVTAERPLVFAEPNRLIVLGWAVHLMDEDDLHGEPEKRTVTILVYRDAEHRSRFLELTPLAAAILERLLNGEALGPAITEACRETSHPLDDSVLGGAARLLADLGERGVLLGAAG